MDNDIVRWVPSQSPIPALQQLIKEAERDTNARQPMLTDPDSPPPRPTRHPRKHPARSPQPSYQTQEDSQPEAAAFAELLKDAFKQLDENSLKKQRLAARAREKQRDRSHTSVARPLSKTPSIPSLSTEHRGRALVKTSSLDPRVGIAPAPSFPHHSCSPKPASAPQLHARPSATPAYKPIPHEASLPDGDSSMQDLIDLTGTDTNREQPASPPVSLCIHPDDNDDSDSGMDLSFFQPAPPPPTHASVRTRKHNPSPPPPPQPSTALRPPPPIQRVRTGPPPLGMRRAALLPPSQYTPSQTTKGVTVPRFKPPLLTNTAAAANKSSIEVKLTATAAGSPPPQSCAASKPAVAPKVTQKNQDPDSSFDMSFDMDIDALEEAMKAYD